MKWHSKSQIARAGCNYEGGKILTGGKASELGGTFYQPTLITEATSAMLFAHEELLAPLPPASVLKPKPMSLPWQMILLCLSAYFYARDIGRVWRVAEGLEARDHWH